MTSGFALLTTAYMVTAVAHLIIKKGADSSVYNHPAKLWINPRMLAGYTLMLISSLISLKVFQVLPIKYGVMLFPVALLVVAFGSVWLFAEEISPRAAWGLRLIVCGMLVFNLARTD
jgi:multidrug transporter EmrE-like cation transporter